MRHTAETLLLATVMLLAPLPLCGADRAERRLAITDGEQVDGDFAFQGEYLGSIWKNDAHDGLRDGRMGLQVVALGDGRFSAVAYWGGLPGNGWSGGPRTKLAGEREGDVLLLRSPSLQITIADRTAQLQSPSGRPAGELQKVRRTSSTLGAAPRPGAVVLFDGTGTEHFRNGRMTDGGELAQGAELKQRFGDYTLHIEYQLPYMPYGRGQGRANSGVYLQSRYEVQILDSFGLEGKHNECGALYRYRKPDLNMCFPPLSWQTYDIHFRSPRYDMCGNKLCHARLSVLHNGVPIHWHVSVVRKTGAGRPERPELLPIRLQDHGNPVRFRNIWIIDRTERIRLSAAPARLSIGLRRGRFVLFGRGYRASYR